MKNKGITLVALVVTIVIMLILAGVSIGLILGDDGLVSRTTEATILHEIAYIEENLKLKSVESMFESSSFTPAIIEDFLRQGIVTRRVDEEGDKAYLRYTIDLEKAGISSTRGNGDSINLRDVFCINTDFKVCYIDENGKVYGDNETLELINDTVIEFADSHMQQYIAERLNLNPNEITYGDIKGITSLSLHYTGITSLEDLYFFRGLTELDIAGETFENLNGIENCENLKVIDFASGDYSGIKITDSSALSKLNNVEIFRIGFNKGDINEIITNIKDYKNLKTLYIRGDNKITSLNILSQLSDDTKKSITTLYVWESKVSDITELKNFTNLTYIDLKINEIENISCLAKLSNLQTINLSENKIKDISSLKDLNNLKNLYLFHNDITEESVLEMKDKFKQMSNLSLDMKLLNTLKENGVTITALYLDEILKFESDKKEEDQELLKTQTQLTTLYLTNAVLNDWSFISNLTNLKNIRLVASNFSNTSLLSKLTSLIWIDVYNTKITTFVPIVDIINKNNTQIVMSPTEMNLLSNCTGLTKVNLKSKINWPLSTLNPLSQLTNLESITITPESGRLKITDLSPLSNLNKLSSLTITNGNIATGLNAISNKTTLKTLNLSNNSIRDITELKKMTWLTSLNVSGNYLTDDQKQELKNIFGNKVTT